VRDRQPVVVATGQSIERAEIVSALDLAERAADTALADAKGLRDAVDRVSVVNMLTPPGPAPAAALARRLGLAPVVTEVSTIGGNSPQMLVTKAASAIAAGEAEVVLIAGAEAQRSQRVRRQAGSRVDTGVDTGGDTGVDTGGDTDGAAAAERLDPGPDTVVGDERAGVGDRELNAGLIAPVHMYALFESALARRAGRGFAEHRAALGELMAPFTEVAAAHPFAWFPEARTPAQLATVSPDNRLVSDPFTKRLCAVMGVDQGAALLVTSLGAARAAGLADGAVFCWSAAAASDVWFPTARPDLAVSPGIGAAVGAALATAGIGVDDLDALDLYSCFPCAVEMAADAMGIALDDRRGLTVTGGLPYFGGPGNNYTLHAIATMVQRLRDEGGTAMVTGLGWYATKHAAGIFGAAPPPKGFGVADTSAAQAAIDAQAVEVVAGTEDGASTTAVVIGATVGYDAGGTPTSAPVIARLDDGRQVAAMADEAELAALAGVNLVGSTIRLGGTPPHYRVEG
jgi:acetyl-CoA C-acetyltransferase